MGCCKHETCSEDFARQYELAISGEQARDALAARQQRTDKRLKEVVNLAGCSQQSEQESTLTESVRSGMNWSRALVRTTARAVGSSGSGRAYVDSLRSTSDLNFSTARMNTPVHSANQ